jgi:hypothetical protein
MSMTLSQVNFKTAEHFLPSITYPIKAFKTNAVITSLPPKSRTCISYRNRKNKEQILITLDYNRKGNCYRKLCVENNFFRTILS